MTFCLSIALHTYVVYVQQTAWLPVKMKVSMLVTTVDSSYQIASCMT